LPIYSPPLVAHAKETTQNDDIAIAAIMMRLLSGHTSGNVCPHSLLSAYTGKLRIASRDCETRNRDALGTGD